ncbi:surface lipoprotein assembly modifier [Roseinatronobacter alkalisoli]|uniref:Surface lipoprotein assembly modifier n=1 Tax=Roseinatronobacter alkalisoli TaxID=3028235 RepID=A0ABT5TAJ1_9RHOB|nr:surface lipoprotein assembly modifier [Roseinatronobacter sp. HJB301]MDD7971959.1 surface lipoprotein assembly modifier [Roseinatronobacter sp. HJB301]
MLSGQVSADPADPEARIRLAMALLLSGAPDRARYHLLQARGTPLAVAERIQLDALLARIEPRRDREGWLSFAIVPETNPAQRTDTDTIWIGDVPFRLNPNARAQRATGLHISAGGALMPQISAGLRVRLGASVAARLYGNRALRDITLRGDLGLQGQTTGGHDWQITGSLARRSLGGRSFGQGMGLHMSWSQRLGRASVLRLRMDGVNWRFANHPALDGPQLSASADLRHVLRPDLVLTATVSVSRIKARAAHEAGRSLRVGLGAQQSFAGGPILGIDAYTQTHRRDGGDPVLGIIRSDNQVGLRLRAMHRDLTLGTYSPAIEISTTRQRSNSPLHTWRNTRASLSLSRAF